MTKQTPKVRAMMLLERLEKDVAKSPTLESVKELTTVAHENGDIQVIVNYDDGSVSSYTYSPEMGAYDMAFDARQAMDRDALKIRQARRTFGLS